MTITVIIPTYNRLETIKRCIECLQSQVPAPDQIIVVDASPGPETGEYLSAFPSVLYLRNENGRGNTPNSRNMALKHSTGDIIAFLDDDAFAHPGWTANLIATYADVSISGVAGRALNNQPGEDTAGVDAIGLMKPNGMLTGNFAADPGKIVEVDHMIGCNMSLRREVIMQLGGFQDDYKAGPFGLCEETEICVRAKRLGHRLVFNPAVCADHIGAPQPGGRRFSAKYTYYHSRNNLVMLMRNFGVRRITVGYIATMIRETTLGFLRRIAAGILHFAAGAAGLVVGLAAGVWLLLKKGSDPVRRDAIGNEITNAMKGNTIPPSSSDSDTPDGGSASLAL